MTSPSDSRQTLTSQVARHWSVQTSGHAQLTCHWTALSHSWPSRRVSRQRREHSGRFLPVDITSQHIVNHAHYPPKPRSPSTSATANGAVDLQVVNCLLFVKSTGRAKKSNPLRKILYLSHYSRYIYQICTSLQMRIQSTYAANFIKITNAVQQIQQFKL